MSFDRGGGFFVSYPLKKGDHVLLVFSERSIDQFMAQDKNDPSDPATDPLDDRRFNLSDAVAYPGFYPDSKDLKDVDPQNMVIGMDGGVQIHFKPNGEIHIGSKDAADALAKASLVDARVDTLQAAHDGHTHITTATIGAGPAPGIISPTGAPVGPLATTASDVVKSD